jgi:hypothetical protein
LAKLQRDFVRAEPGRHDTQRQLTLQACDYPQRLEFVVERESVAGFDLRCGRAVRSHAQQSLSG